MKLKDFNYELPEELIAQKPLHRRAEARLMVIDRSNKTIKHDVFKNIDQHLPQNSLMVANNSKVVPARLLGKRNSGGQVEIFLLNKKDDGYTYEALMRPLKRLKVGEKISFNGGSLIAEIQDKEKRTVRFNKRSIYPILNRIGHIPLPPYIKRKDRAEDKKYYQTVYAKKPGSVAAPTAGLHFTNSLISKLKAQGHDLEQVTLHINYSTFKPVEVEDISEHQMHIEDYEVSKFVWNKVQKAQDKNRPIVAIGTTSSRVLETVAKTNRRQGETDIFMYPGYQFRLVNALVTNFHLPQSTLLMLVYAFGGNELMKKAYRLAVKEKYRFFSYGDAMLIK